MMTRKIWLSVLTGFVFVLGTAAMAGAHEKKTGKASGAMMECGEHHSAAMKASDDVSMHLAEAKKSTTLAEMRKHVEMADKAMAEMKTEMSTCMEMMGKMHGEKMGAGTPSGATAAAKALDPVCGMEVDKANAPTTTYKGQTYYFCSEDDKAEFLENPEQYAAKKP
jgi:YHS domain-containing protein